MGRVGDAIHRFLDAFGAASRRHVTKTPDPAHGAAVQSQRNRIPLDHPAVFEVENVEAVGLRFGVPLLNAIDEKLRIDELRLHVLDQVAASRRVAVGGDHRRRQVPDLLKAAVVGDDLPIQIDDQHSIRRGLERGLQDRDGQRIDGSTGFLRPRLRLGPVFRHGPNVRVAARVTSLTGPRPYRT